MRELVHEGKIYRVDVENRVVMVLATRRGLKFWRRMTIQDGPLFSLLMEKAKRL